MEILKTRPFRGLAADDSAVWDVPGCVTEAGTASSVPPLLMIAYEWKRRISEYREALTSDLTRLIQPCREGVHGLS
jgi:hypothetical protein